MPFGGSPVRPPCEELRTYACPRPISTVLSRPGNSRRHTLSERFHPHSASAWQRLSETDPLPFPGMSRAPYRVDSAFFPALRTIFSLCPVSLLISRRKQHLQAFQLNTLSLDCLSHHPARTGMISSGCRLLAGCFRSHPFTAPPHLLNGAALPWGKLGSSSIRGGFGQACLHSQKFHR